MSILNSVILNSIGDEDNRFVAVVVGVAAVLATTAAYYAISSKDKKHDFPKLRGIQFYHAWNFFQRRHDFLQSNFKRNLGKSFSFNVLHHNIVALTGEEARRVFFSHASLDLDEGYKVLRGGAPRTRDVATTALASGEGDSAVLTKTLNKILKVPRMQEILPSMLQDIIDSADTWGDDGTTGRIDPFTEVYDLVFVMTTRMVACHDLARNEADLKKARQLVSTFQASTTPTSLLLPWFPSSAKKENKEAATGLFAMLYPYVEARRHAEFANDAIDILIADGETTQAIVGFVMTALFAGVVTTGLISCWTLVDFVTHPEWRDKCKKEVQDLLSSYVDDPSSKTLSEKLRAVPLSAWEGELPILEACIRESHRITSSGAAIRRNLYEDVKIGEQVVKRGDFLVFSLGSVHLNPEFYPEPEIFDPARWLRPDPPPTFLGWGAGRHPCAGMRLAKLEMKLAMAMLLTRYEFDLVDKDGKFPDPLPARDRNAVQQVRPLGATCYLDFRKVVD